MGVECWLLYVVRRIFGAQVGRVVRWLFGLGFVGLLVVLIDWRCRAFFCFLRVTHSQIATCIKYVAPRSMCPTKLCVVCVLLRCAVGAEP